MTTRAAFRENSFATSHHCFVVTDQVGAAWCVREVKRFQLPKEGRDVVEPFFSGEPEDGVLARVRDLEWLLGGQAEQAIVASEPILGKHSDVHENPDRGAA